LDVVLGVVLVGEWVVIGWKVGCGVAEISCFCCEIQDSTPDPFFLLCFIIQGIDLPYLAANCLSV